MGYREISLKLPADYNEDEMRKGIGKELGIQEFSYQIENKSLDARKKENIHWLVRVLVLSGEVEGGVPLLSPSLEIPYRKRRERAVVVGSGPAGFFSAFILQKAGFHTTIIEGLKDFSRKIKGFETGSIMGLESKTSSPIQVLREKDSRCTGFENLYIVGEGSGCAGGIISSGADGIKAAMHIIENNA